MSKLYKKRETRNTYEPHKQTTTTVHQVPGLGKVQTNAAGLNVYIGTNLHSYMKQSCNWHYNIKKTTKYQHINTSEHTQKYILGFPFWFERF